MSPTKQFDADSDDDDATVAAIADAAEWGADDKTIAAVADAAIEVKEWDAYLPPNRTPGVDVLRFTGFITYLFQGGWGGAPVDTFFVLVLLCSLSPPILFFRGPLLPSSSLYVVPSCLTYSFRVDLLSTL